MVGKFQGHRRTIPSESEVCKSYVILMLYVISGWPPLQTHGFMCAGILPSQYNHFSQFAGIGVIGSWYIQHGKLE